MLGPRIESFGIQRRRAENAHQGALRGHGAGSVACDSRAPLIHVKAITALPLRRESVSTASNESLASTAARDIRTPRKVAPGQTRRRAAATLNGCLSPHPRHLPRI